MIFWRIINDKLHPIDDVKKLGFNISDPSYIPDEYLEKQEFVVMRTCHGLGDWGIVSALPRLLKEKYPDCKVYIPSKKFIKNTFGIDSNMMNVVFENNPYVDEFKDNIDDEIFHDHYRIYDNENEEVSFRSKENHVIGWDVTDEIWGKIFVIFFLFFVF